LAPVASVPPVITTGPTMAPFATDFASVSFPACTVVEPVNVLA
jgi:hypothetical protein